MEASLVPSHGSPTSVQNLNTSVALKPTEAPPTHAPPQNSPGELMISTGTELLNELHKVHCEKKCCLSVCLSVIVIV